MPVPKQNETLQGLGSTVINGLVHPRLFSTNGDDVADLLDVLKSCRTGVYYVAFVEAIMLTALCLLYRYVTRSFESYKYPRKNVTLLRMFLFTCPVVIIFLLMAGTESEGLMVTPSMLSKAPWVFYLHPFKDPRMPLESLFKVPRHVLEDALYSTTDFITKAYSTQPRASLNDRLMAVSVVERAWTILKDYLLPASYSFAFDGEIRAYLQFFLFVWALPHGLFVVALKNILTLGTLIAMFGMLSILFIFLLHVAMPYRVICGALMTQENTFAEDYTLLAGQVSGGLTARTFAFLAEQCLGHQQQEQPGEIRVFLTEALRRTGQAFPAFQHAFGLSRVNNFEQSNHANSSTCTPWAHTVLSARTAICEIALPLLEVHVGSMVLAMALLIVLFVVVCKGFWRKAEATALPQ